MQKKVMLFVSLFLSFTNVYAQVNGEPLISLVDFAQTIVTKLSPLLVGLALLAFFWFLINFIWLAKDNPEGQQKSMKGMGMSILALFVMVSIWGIVNFIGAISGIGQGGKMPVLELPKAK